VIRRFGCVAAVVFCGTVANAQIAASVCAPCHRAETARFEQAAMTHALAKASDSSVLRNHPQLIAKLRSASYQISSTGVDTEYSVTDGSGTMRTPLGWAFGQGGTGQTYLYQRDGRWFESRVSFFAGTGALDLTIGFQNIAPHNLSEAAGRAVPAAEVTECFNCHAGNVSRAMPPGAGVVPGIQCERCHGPAAEHVASLRAMPRLGRQTTEEMSDFCGECHRTWAKVASDGPRGIQNIRFQPYRLGNSKCYDAFDSRIRCTACHNPHAELEKSAVAYDARCLACHSRKAAPATRASLHICKAATKNCVTCHMPALELPGAHRKFTDHTIRIVAANERYPE
jgi:hypothetical protein